MSNVKERIIGALTVLSDDDALKIWCFLEENFSKKSWGDIEEVEPDDIDLEMLKEIDSNPDCKKFISEEEVLKTLGL